MRVDTGRWGEITIKKQGARKNLFDQTKSFSIANTDFEYSIEELKDIYKIVTNLTEVYSFKELKNRMHNMNKRGEKEE